MFICSGTIPYKSDCYRTCKRLDDFFKNEVVEYDETLIKYLELENDDFDYSHPKGLFAVPEDFTDDFVETHIRNERQKLNEKRAKNKQQKNNHDNCENVENYDNFDNFDNFDSFQNNDSCDQDGISINRLEFSIIVFLIFMNDI